MCVRGGGGEMLFEITRARWAVLYCGIQIVPKTTGSTGVQLSVWTRLSSQHCRNDQQVVWRKSDSKTQLLSSLVVHTSLQGKRLEQGKF